MYSSTIPENNMTDIHMHLVPGVDDGAESLDMALDMIWRARLQGITAIFATPHGDAFRRSPERPRIRFESLKNAAAECFPDVKLYPGCEIYCEVEQMDRIAEELDSGLYPTLNGTSFVLVEFSAWVDPDRTLPCLEKLVSRGYTPVVAHMERYVYLQDNMDLVNRFREAGARIQINAYSLFDEDNTGIRNWARRLVLERKADFLGTDAHRTYHRPPSAKYGLEWLYENVERDYADEITFRNAATLLCGRNG